MPASRGRTGLRLCVLVTSLALGLGTIGVTSARSGRPATAASAPPRVLPGMELHMHGDQPHYHEITSGTDDARRGLVFKGLKRARTHDHCDGGYRIRTNHRPACSHGPDEAPEGVDVRSKPSAADFRAADTTGSPAALPCYSDGASGPRVQAIYAHPAGTADRFAEFSRFFPEWAAHVDSVYARSARETGGDRHVRWVTNSDCTLNVIGLELSSSGADTLTSMIDELTARGYDRTDRKYLVWTDASVYCGIAEVRNDDTPDAGNRNNFGPSFARVDAACWGRAASVEAHELMHTLGGIQNSAPHATGGWHCADENDRMCLADTPGVTLSYPCPAEHEELFDCGHDDYFSTAPVAGTYLATHWNAANSSFLSADLPESCRITTQTTTSPPQKQKQKHKRRHHRRHAARTTDAVPCVPQSAFG